MPPKARKAKKAAHKKAQEPEKEIDKSFYENQITDLNRILSHLRSNQLNLEAKNEELVKAKESLHQDEKDIIQYLNRTIQERNDDISKVQNDYNRVEDERAKDLQEFEDQKQSLMDNYRQTEENLLSDMKLLVGKVHALEEFRLHRDELMKKYEIMEDALEEQTVRHKQEIYDVERKFIIGKDKLKKEMDAKLQWLIEQFQSVTDLRVAATTHRVIKENIALNNKLEEMLERLKKLYHSHEKFTLRDDKLQIMSQMLQSESTIISNRSHKLLTRIITLVNEYFGMLRKINKGKHIEPTVKKYNEQKEKQKLAIEEVTQKKRILSQNLHEFRCQREELTEEIRCVDGRNQHLIQILLNAKDTVATIKDSSDMCIVYDTYAETTIDSERTSKSALLYQLCECMKQLREWHRQPEVVERLEQRDDIYMQGRLGLVPREIILKSMIPSKENKGEQADGSYYDLLYKSSESGESRISEEEASTVISFVEQETQTVNEPAASNKSAKSTSSSSGSSTTAVLEEDQ